MFFFIFSYFLQKTHISFCPKGYTLFSGENKDLGSIATPLLYRVRQLLAYALVEAKKPRETEKC